MARKRWQESVLKVEQVLRELRKMGRGEIGLIELAVLTNFSPTYLRDMLIPALQLKHDCVRMEKGRIYFECLEGG